VRYEQHLTVSRDEEDQSGGLRDDEDIIEGHKGAGRYHLNRNYVPKVMAPMCRH